MLSDFVHFLSDLSQLLIIKILSIILQVLALPFELISLFHQYVMQKRKIFKSVVITGASSGIGRHFALEMAKQKPPPRLILIARRPDKLKEVRMECMRLGCTNVSVFQCDVRDRKAMREFLIERDTQTPHIDLVFANAGYRANVDDEMVTAGYKTMDINLYGVMNTIMPLIPRMKERGKGQIIINASIAALTPHKLFPFYSASKHALVALAENLRSGLHEYGIGVTVLLPGFVKTELISHLNDSKLPLIGMINVTDAIQRIRSAAEYNQAIAGFPFIATVLGYLYETVSPRFKQTLLDFSVVDRLIGFYNVVPDRAWNPVEVVKAE